MQLPSAQENVGAYSIRGRVLCSSQTSNFSFLLKITFIKIFTEVKDKRKETESVKTKEIKKKLMTFIAVTNLLSVLPL